MVHARAHATRHATIFCCMWWLRFVCTASGSAGHVGGGDQGGSGGFVQVEKDSQGVWWFVHKGQRFFSTGVSNVNNGGSDDGVGGVLSAPCQQQQNTTLCGDTNNWDMVRNYAPYHNITQELFNDSEPAWADDAVSRLRFWGFNTLGGYSSGVAEAAAGSQGTYYNKLLMFATRFAMPDGTALQQTTKCGCFAYDVFGQYTTLIAPLPFFKMVPNLDLRCVCYRIPAPIG